LKLLYDYFSALDSANESLKETHPNYYDAKTAIQAHYLLNDIMLGTILEDAEIGKEHNELLITLEDLAREAGIRIDINAIKNVIAKLDAEKVKENVIKKNRSVFRQQLKDLITPVPT
jgi:ATP-dependent Lon protease